MAKAIEYQKHARLWPWFATNEANPEGIVNLFVGMKVTAELERGNRLESSAFILSLGYMLLLLSIATIDP